MAGTSGSGVESLKKWVQDYVQNIVNGRGINAYPIGSYYFTSDARNPSEILGGGTWEKLEEGRFLMASGNSHPVGETGGEAEHTLSENEMPSHGHSGSLSGSTGSVSGHSHGRGSMDITGTFNAWTYSGHENSSGAISRTGYAQQNGYVGGNGNTYSTNYSLTASNNWTGSTGSGGTHSHSLSGASITTSEAGGNQPHNNLPPYIAVNIWRRTA